MNHGPWYKTFINRKEYMRKKIIKDEFLPGGERRQELLNQVPEYLKAPGIQANKHVFCIEVLRMTETEYLEALNKATNGGIKQWAN